MGVLGTVADMAKRLPDELFRNSGNDKSDEGGGGSGADHPLRGSTRYSRRGRDSREFGPAMVVAGVLGALLVGFGVGELVPIQRDVETVPMATLEPAMTRGSASATPSPETTLAPWSGPVRTIPALDATGGCLNAMGDAADPPANLVDEDASSQWRCPGPGVGETVSFVLPEGEEVVGVRLINGNTTSYDRYLEERRILSIKWEFSDNSWVVQPLAANDRTPQEFRFPPTTVSGPVTMTVLDATVPGDSSGEDGDGAVGRNDAVSISSLQFLGVA